MFNNAIRRMTNKKLRVQYPDPPGIELPVNLLARTYFPAGQVLGQYATTASDVQTLTVTGGPTGGDMVATVYHPMNASFDTIVIPYNSSAATAQGLIRGLLGANVTVTGGPLPGTPLVFTFSGSYANMMVGLMTVVARLTGGTAPAATMAKTTNGRTKGTFGKYNDANSDGTETARCLLSYECSTDYGGIITPGPSSIENYNGEVWTCAPAYFGGNFLTKELTGLDLAAVADLGKLKTGTVADGLLVLV